MLTHMRTTIDIPDSVAERLRAIVTEEKTTLRDIVVEGLRRELQRRSQKTTFRLRDGRFDGPVGFAPGFEAASLTAAIHEDWEERGQ